MKKLLLLCLPLALLYACGDKAHKTTFEFDKATTGLHITSVKDTFNKYKGAYFVSAMVKNDTKDIVTTFLVTAKYMDGKDEITAESSAGTGKAIAPGDSALVENTSEFSSNESLPFKVKLAVKSLQ